MVELPERAIKIRYDFEEVFYENASKCKSYAKAYEMTEQEHERFYRRRRYASYDSFKNRKQRKK
jgi:hypothetical protein